MAARRSLRTALSTAMSEPTARTPLTSAQRLLAIGLVLAVTLVAFEVTAIITALPTIADELDGDSQYGVALAVYTLANMVVLVAAGELADRYGPALPFIASIITFIAGLVVAGLAQSMEWVVIGRLLQGAGTGGFNPISYSLVRRAFPTDRQPMVYAFLSAGWVLPSLVAPLIAGWITDTFGWRWVFYAIIPAALAVGLLAVRPMLQYPAIAIERPRSRVPIATVAAAGLGAVAIGLQLSSVTAMAVTTLAGIALAVPALHRLLPSGYRRAAHGFAAVLVARTVATLCFGGIDSFIPLAADRIHGVGPTAQGFVIIGAAITWTFGQWIRARRPGGDPARKVSEGFVVLGVGAVLSVPVLSADWPLWATFVGWAVGGVGMGLLFNPTTVTSMGYATEGNEGMVSSQVALADSIGWTLVGALGGASVAAADRGSATITTAIGANFGVAILLAVVGVLVSRRIRPAAMA